MKNYIDLLGRILLSFIFFYDAYDSIFYFNDTRQSMINYGLTWSTDLLLIGGSIVLVLGAIMILIGYRIKLGVVLLLFYWIPVTFITHSFWNDPESMERIQSIMFMKNLSIIGGLLVLYANGTGKLSIRRLFATTRVPGTR